MPSPDPDAPDRDPDAPGPDPDDPGLVLADLFAHWPEAARPFLDRRMRCPGCPIAPFHGVAEACSTYALDEAAFRRAVNRAIRRGGGVSARSRSAPQGHADR